MHARSRIPIFWSEQFNESNVLNLKKKMILLLKSNFNYLFFQLVSMTRNLLINAL